MLVMHGAGERVTDFVDDVGLSLLALTRAYRDNVGAVLAGVPQGPRGYQTLAMVVRGEQPSQLALATCLGIDRTVMTYLIDDLVTAGLVERQLNPADRRQRRIVPTEHGISTHDDLQRQVREAEDKLLDALDPAERETFRNLLSRATARLHHSGPVPEGDSECFRS
jgi:DNA-binding MarR family transcriptional regulator